MFFPLDVTCEITIHPTTPINKKKVSMPLTIKKRNAPSSTQYSPSPKRVHLEKTSSKRQSKNADIGDVKRRSTAVTVPITREEEESPSEEDGISDDNDEDDEMQQDLDTPKEIPTKDPNGQIASLP